MGAEPVPVQVKSVKEQIRDQKRSVDRSKRSLEREAKKLERDRKKMLTEIKKLASKGQTQGAKMMAKDIVRCKNQEQKLQQFIGQLNAISLRIGMCNSLNELGDAMHSATTAMTLVSGKLDVKTLAQLGKTLAKEDMKMEMKSDMISEVLDSLDEGNEEEEEEIYNQVLAEAGVNAQTELPGKQQEGEVNKVSDSSIKAGVDDLDQMLNDLNK